jgi:hypothetical protein
MLLADALEATLPGRLRALADGCDRGHAWRRPWRWTSGCGEAMSLSRAEREAAAWSGWAVWSLGEFVVRRGMH